MRHIVFAVLFLGAFVASAHVPFIVTQNDLHDIVTVDDLGLSQAFYGKLEQFPHTYEFVSTEKQELFVEILVPDIDSSTNNISAIIVREAERSGRVTEIARLKANEASWESFFEPFGGDSYRRGPNFMGFIEPGKYRIEVHTPDNIEKYVLVIGKQEELGGISYFELVRRVADVKEFFEKPRISIIQSPYVYVPLLIIMLILGCFLWYRRRSQLVG